MRSHFRNRIAASWVVWGLLSCASSLKHESEITGPPIEFEQKIEKVDLSKYVSPKNASSDPSQALKTFLQSAQPNPKVTKGPQFAALSKPNSSKPKTKKERLAAAAAATAAAAKNAKIAKEFVDGSPVLSSKPSVAWTPNEWPYGIGEKITLVLRYGPIEGGIATMEVNDPVMINGETVLHYSAKVHSSKMLEFFYKVDDSMDSWVRIEDHLPLRQEIRQLESARWGRRVVVFNKNEHLAKFYANATTKEGHTEEIKREDPMTPFAQDVFGALYFYRFALDLNHLNFPIHDRFRNWQNELTFLGKESVMVPAGEFMTQHFKMFPRVSGQLEPKGDVEIWVKDDPSRVLVQFKAHIKVGSVTGELKAYEPGTPIHLPLPRMRTPTSLEAGSLVSQ